MNIGSRPNGANSSTFARKLSNLIGFRSPLSAPISDRFSAPRNKNSGALSASCAYPGCPKTVDVKAALNSRTKCDSWEPPVETIYCILPAINL